PHWGDGTECSGTPSPLVGEGRDEGEASLRAPRTLSLASAPYHPGRSAAPRPVIPGGAQRSRAVSPETPHPAGRLPPPRTKRGARPRASGRRLTPAFQPGSRRVGQMHRRLGTEDLE